MILNTTSKAIAALSGGLTILSYTATAVVSATTASTYLQTLWPYLADNNDVGTVALLGIIPVSLDSAVALYAYTISPHIHL